MGADYGTLWLLGYAILLTVAVLAFHVYYRLEDSRPVSRNVYDSTDQWFDVEWED